MNLKSISYREQFKNEIAPVLKYSLLVSLVPQVFWVWNTFSSIGVSFERSNHASRQGVLVNLLSEHVKNWPQTNNAYLSDSFSRAQMDLVKITNESSIQSPRFLELLSFHQRITKLLEKLNSYNHKAISHQLSELTWEYSKAIKKIIADCEIKIRQEELKLAMQVFVLASTVAGLALLFFLGEIRQLNLKAKKNEVGHPP
jgi:hypothetical protein